MKTDLYRSVFLLSAFPLSRRRRARRENRSPPLKRGAPPHGPRFAGSPYQRCPPRGRAKAADTGRGFFTERPTALDFSLRDSALRQPVPAGAVHAPCCESGPRPRAFPIRSAAPPCRGVFLSLSPVLLPPAAASPPATPVFLRRGRPLFPRLLPGGPHLIFPRLLFLCPFPPSVPGLRRAASLPPASPRRAWVFFIFFIKRRAAVLRRLLPRIMGVPPSRRLSSGAPRVSRPVFFSGTQKP